MHAEFYVSFPIVKTVKNYLSGSSPRLKFEMKFNEMMNEKNAITTPYGRTAIYGFFKCLNITNKEIIIPAYTCSVVAHSVVLSGNKPIFCDTDLKTFNIDLEEIENKITEQTAGIIVTNNFGFSVDPRRVQGIIKKAEAKYGKKIWYIQDCAHAFDAKYDGININSFSDASIYGMNISKSLTSVFGGVICTNDEALTKKLRNWERNNIRKGNLINATKKIAYICVAKMSFTNLLYGVTNLLSDKVHFVRKLRDGYHKDNKIHFPKDSFIRMTRFQYAVGLANLELYKNRKKERLAIANEYKSLVKQKTNWITLEFAEGSNPSHFPILVENREELCALFARMGVKLGRVIDYVIPLTNPYINDKNGDYLKSRFISDHILNLPLKKTTLKKISLIITKYLPDQNTDCDIVNKFDPK